MLQTISRIYIRNFLSLRDVDIRLGKLNIFIGPNAAGKSNFVKAFLLLRNTAYVGVPVLDENMSEIFFTDMVYNFNNYDVIEIRTEVSSGSSTAVYEIRVSNNGYEEKVFSGNREVCYREWRFREAYYVTSTGERKGLVGVPSKSVIFVIRYPGPPEIIEKRNLLLYESLLRSPPLDADSSIHTVSTILKRIGVFRLDPAYLRLVSSITQPPSVGYRGENLVRYLLYLYLERPEDFRRVEDAVQNLVPEVERLIPRIEDTNVELLVKSKGLSLPVKPMFISDGTLRLAAITILLYSGFSVIAVEEPENHVHPYLLEALVDLARRSPSQVVFTTHSPYLLDYARPEEVYLVYKVGTETRIRRLVDTDEFEKVRKFLEEGGTLGEAWFSRIFGE